MENINYKAEQIQKDVINRNNKQYTKADLVLIESVRRLKNPFKMIDVQYVMNDLGICETIAYKTFKRPDYPSNKIGKKNQVMLLAYILWKMEKRD